MQNDPRIVWQRKSRYALVNCINTGRNGLVVEKQIAPENVNFWNARWVNETSMYFRKRLREIGVPMAEPYTFVERDDKAIQCSPYVGPDLDTVFSQGEATAETLQKIFSAMRGILSQTEREVGIDARLSNFCLSSESKLYYVDTFPPLVKYEGEFIVHFPNPTDPKIVEQELKRKFDPLGIIRRMRYSILAQDVGINEQHILVAIRKIMGKSFGRRVHEFFQTLPDNKDVSVALSELSLEDPDSIRELALRFMPTKGKDRADYFSKVFDLSSNFCPFKITAEEKIQRLHELFVGNIS